jgi:hypothetical protein
MRCAVYTDLSCRQHVLLVDPVEFMAQHLEQACACHAAAGQEEGAAAVAGGGGTGRGGGAQLPPPPLPPPLPQCVGLVRLCRPHERPFMDNLATAYALLEGGGRGGGGGVCGEAGSHSHAAAAAGAGAAAGGCRGGGGGAAGGAVGRYAVFGSVMTDEAMTR